LAAFAQFASDLDEATRAQINRGQRVTELMKQKQFQPLSVAEMAVSLFSANEGFLDDVEVSKVGDFEAALLSNMNSSQAELMATINESGNFNDDIAGQMRTAIESFKKTGSW
jgi:F-type H+-transporting ATPase subunit alpha